MTNYNDSAELSMDELNDVAGGIDVTITFGTKFGKAGVAWNAAQGGGYTGAMEAATWLLFF